MERQRRASGRPEGKTKGLVRKEVFTRKDTEFLRNHLPGEVAGLPDGGSLAQAPANPEGKSPLNHPQKTIVGQGVMKSL